jgi:histidinol dehydrogenase
MQILDWSTLTAAERLQALARPAQRDADGVRAQARTIIDRVRRGGDAALDALTRELDRAAPATLRVTADEMSAAERALTPEQIASMERAIDNVRRFHAAQAPGDIRLETAPGVLCERLTVPVRAVGLYVPAGSAPLPSTAIMLGVPAAIAGCPIRVLCTPPAGDGRADAGVLVAARRSGIEHIFKVGGAQAVAAMAYGTESIPKCDKVFGPGNAWVTAAKLLVSQDPAGAAADLPAGVTEVLVIADDSAAPSFVAADLLAQAEHSPEAQSLLITPSAGLAAAVARELERQSAVLSRRQILAESMQNMRLIVVRDLKEALAIANDHAPEHLLLEVNEPRRWLAEVRAAGAVFLGHWSPETMGDYCSGPNHTLPTYGFARAYSGLSLEDFQKRITVQELTPEGLIELSSTARVLAALEGLDAHAAAVSVRLAALPGGAP